MVEHGRAIKLTQIREELDKKGVLVNNKAGLFEKMVAKAYDAADASAPRM